MLKALLVSPDSPPSFWGYNYALDFKGKKANLPPLGLLTVAGMFPKDYQLKVVDMYVTPLTDADLDWADVVLTSTMIVQRDSLYNVIERCNRAGVPVVAGGPYPTSYHQEIGDTMKERDGWVDHFVLDEVEDYFSDFLRDLENGVAKPMYRAKEKPDVTKTPLPRYDLIDFEPYGSMALQFSRGCPFDCEFCDITKLFGRIPRTKTVEQTLSEFDLLYESGWRGLLFLVDDNFIGNKRDTMRLLPAIAEWQAERNYPFLLYTETSANVVEIPGMLEAMADAGFTMTFVGIESPNDETLEKMVKKQNTSKQESAESYLLRAVRQIQEAGIEVTAGFIVGLDGDKQFQSHIDFVQNSGIPRAVTGLLTALKDTNLYNRLEREGRLLPGTNGMSGNVELNFIPELDRDFVISEYKRVLRALYEPSLKSYFERSLTLLKHWNPKQAPVRIGKEEIGALIKSFQRQLLSLKQGPSYLWFLLRVLSRFPRKFPDAVQLAILGYHHERITSHQIAVDNFKQYLGSELDTFKQTVAQLTQTHSDPVRKVSRCVQRLLKRVQTQYELIHPDFRDNLEDVLDSFQESLKLYLEQFVEPTPQIQGLD